MKLLLYCYFLFAFPAALVAQTPLENAKRLYEDKRYPEAVKLLDKVDDTSRDYAAARYYLGRIAYDQKQFDEAAEYFEEATEANDKEADYFVWLGNTYGTLAGNANVLRQGFLAPKMKSAWEKAIALDSRNIPARQSLIEYYTKAPGFMGGSFEKAKEIAGQISKLNPVQGHYAMAGIYFQEKDMAGAEKEYQALVALDIKHTSSLGAFYSGQQQYDKAFRLFEDWLLKDPANMLAAYQIGRTSALSGLRLERGDQCLRQYLTYTPKEKEPSRANAYLRLAQITEKRGNKAEAKKLFESALKLDNTLKEATEGLNRLASK